MLSRIYYILFTLAIYVYKLYGVILELCLYLNMTSVKTMCIDINQYLNTHRRDRVAAEGSWSVA